MSPALRRHCLPYVPATTQQLKNVIGALHQEKRHGLLMDIGSGDGRIVIESGKAGVCSEGHGVELNRWLVYYSRWMAYRNGVFSTTKFFQKDLWKYDLSPYNQIVIFGVEEMVSRMMSTYTVSKCTQVCSPLSRCLTWRRSSLKSRNRTR